jgi:hypothetical protein
MRDRCRSGDEGSGIWNCYPCSLPAAVLHGAIRFVTRAAVPDSRSVIIERERESQQSGA